MRATRYPPGVGGSLYRLPESDEGHSSVILENFREFDSITLFLHVI